MENTNYDFDKSKGLLEELIGPLKELNDSIEWYFIDYFKRVLGSIDVKEEGERLYNFIDGKISEILKERNFDEAKSEMLYAYLLGYLSRIVDSYSFVVQKEYSGRIRYLSI